MQMGSKAAMKALTSLGVMGAIVALRGIAGAGQPQIPVFVHVAAPATVVVHRNVNPIKPATVSIKVTIDKGYHLQGNNAKDPYIPTTATVQAPEGVIIGKIVYPPSVKKEFSGETIPVYESKVEIKIPISLSSKVKVGELKVPVTINYHGCNSTSCYPPSKISTTINVKVRRDSITSGDCSIEYGHPSKTLKAH